jgi:pimeloyl-ACP methyl ester carboxylesterase
MSYVSVNGIDLYYEEQGSGSPLVLIHGFSSAGMVWANHVAALTSTYRVIVPDLRGHGRSTGAPDTIHHDRFAADLVALLDHLEVDRAHFVGHSSGGMCLLFVGTRYPERVRTLTLVSATYTFDEVARRQMYLVADSLLNQPEAIAMARRLHGGTHGDDYWKELANVFRGFADHHATELPFQPDDLRAITSPTLVLHGDRDVFFPVNIPTTMYRAIPNAELCILPATNHGLPRESREMFLAILTRFLERHADA